MPTLDVNLRFSESTFSLESKLRVYIHLYIGQRAGSSFLLLAFIRKRSLKTAKFKTTTYCVEAIHGTNTVLLHPGK